MFDRSILNISQCAHRINYLLLFAELHSINQSFFMKKKLNTLTLPPIDDELNDFEIDCFEEFFSSTRCSFVWQNHYVGKDGNEYVSEDEEDEPEYVSTIFLIEEYELYMKLYNTVISSKIPSTLIKKVDFLHKKYEQIWIDLYRSADNFSTEIYDFKDNTGTICGISLVSEFVIQDISAVIMVLGIYTQALTLIPIYKSLLRKYKNYI